MSPGHLFYREIGRSTCMKNHITMGMGGTDSIKCPTLFRIIWISGDHVSVRNVSVLFGQKLLTGVSYVCSMLAPSCNPTFCQEILLI